MKPLAASRAAPIAAVALLLAGAGAWLVVDRPQADAEPSGPASTAAGSAAATPAPAPPSATGTDPVRVAAPADASGPAIPVATVSGLSAGDALQARLDAIAAAYNAGDAQAADRALWKNHAVVRPNGTTLYRSDLLGQWVREWTEFRNRSLSFSLDEVTEDGARVTATWSLILTAQLLDAQGESHDYEFQGTQQATYLRTGNEELLEGPITYLGSHQTMDGYPWRGEQ